MPSVDKKALKIAIMDALRPVHDPEIRIGIVDLGLIYDIAINDDAEVQIKMTLTILRGNGSLTYTIERARFFSNRAKESIDHLPDIPTKYALNELADFLVDRVHGIDSESVLGNH